MEQDRIVKKRTVSTDQHAGSNRTSGSAPGRRQYRLMSKFTRRLNITRFIAPECCASSHFNSTTKNFMLTRRRITRPVGIFRNEVSSNPVFASTSTFDDTIQTEEDLRHILTIDPTAPAKKPKLKSQLSLPQINPSISSSSDQPVASSEAK
ncbi:unnamed protein product [Soboliphyme baturini]|uniref:Uncharacterized protein n=1 Tax=Soboliphyme baturini TaxID=241478 RepID=A0A183I9W5_9BILA|nr:unnamed protein product [Soboliphyme baturini]